MLSRITETGFLGGIFWLILSMFFLFCLLYLFLGDTIGFRFKRSVLFDRNAGKVHVFTDRAVPWRPWRYELKSYDWQCVRAEVDTVSVMTGMFTREEAGLRLLMMDKPHGGEVVDHFVLGVNMPSAYIQPLLDSWEHVRRFMTHQGPLFVGPEDGPNPAMGREPLWKHLIAMPALLYETMLDIFEYFLKAPSIWTLMITVAAVIGSPGYVVFAVYGFFPWIAGYIKRSPIWPPAILDSVGGKALSGSALAAARDVLPNPNPTIREVHAEEPPVIEPNDPSH